MAELLLDKREIIKKDGKYYFKLNQLQEYTEEGYNNLRDQFNKDINERQIWLDHYQDHLDEGIKRVTQEINNMQLQLEEEIKVRKSALKVWENVTEESNE